MGKPSRIRSYGSDALSGRSEGESRFEYDGARQMVRRYSVEQGSTKTIYHAGNVELIKEGEAVTIRRNIGNALVELTGQSSKTRYVYTDHLGSMDVITDVSGRVEQRFGFDAFGKRRIVTGPGHQVTTLNLSAILALTHRGFTGHQQVDHANIIHMGGRIYDSHLGRFLQADPFVQAPSNSQSLNRYSYVLNNPLSYTDPSGYFFKKLKQWAGVIVGVIVAIYCQICGASLINAALTGAAIGAGSAALNGGSIIKGALVGAFSGAAFYQIGASFNANSGFWAEGGAAHIGAHGLAGGVTSVMQGGKFGHGFVSAGLTKALNVNDMIGTAAKDAPLRIMTAAVIGGTTSKIVGGKFGNGAITAAFAQAFNGENQAKRDREIDKYFSHSQELDYDKFEATPMPKDVRKALREIMQSPLGDRIKDGFSVTGEKIQIIRSMYEENAFQTSGNQIYYGDVSTFNARGITMNQTMATLLSHEIGHTQIYLSTFNSYPSLGTTANENWTVTNAEDVFRKWKGLPLRGSYGN